MKANSNRRVLAAVFAAFAMSWTGVAGEASTDVRMNADQGKSIRVDGAEPGEWTHDWEAAAAAANETGMPVFANFTGSDWCPWCKVLERQVFAQPEWIEWARRNVYLVHLDFPNDKTLVPEKYRDRNRELARRYRVGGYPTCLLLDPATLEPIGRFGASRDANAAGFIGQVSAAMPGAKKAEAPSVQPAPPPRSERPATAEAGGKPVFDISNGVLRGTLPNGAEDVVVPATVKRLVYGSFVRAGGVRHVHLPEGLEEIGDRSFENCYSLERVSIPASVRRIGYGVFGACPRISGLEIAPGSKFSFENGILFDKEDKVVLFALPTIKQAVFPEGAREIQDSAFMNCDGLTEVTVPEEVSKIGDMAFFLCTNLALLRLPASLETFGDSAIFGCPALDRIEIRGGGRYSVSGNFLLGDGGKTLVRGFGRLEEIRVPDEITRIAPNAFSYSPTLQKAHVPDTVSDIGYNAFSYCPELEELRLPGKVEKCGNSIAPHCPKLREFAMPECVRELRFTYWGCTSLAKLDIPKSVQTIGQQAIQGCDGLEEIVFPEGVTTFSGNGIVSDCANLVRVVLPSTVEKIAGWNVFGKNPKLENIEVSPANPFFRSVDGVLFDKDVTRLVQCPGAKSGRYEIPATVVEISPFAFSGCRNLTEIRIPDSVKTVGERAFNDCPAKTNWVAAAEAPSVPPASVEDGAPARESGN